MSSRRRKDEEDFQTLKNQRVGEYQDSDSGAQEDEDLSSSEIQCHVSVLCIVFG